MILLAITTYPELYQQLAEPIKRNYSFVPKAVTKNPSLLNQFDDRKITKLIKENSNFYLALNDANKRNANILKVAILSNPKLMQMPNAFPDDLSRQMAQRFLDRA